MQTVTVRGRVYNYSHCVGRNAVSGAGFHYPNGLVRGEGNIVFVVNQPDELQPVPHITKVDVGQAWHQEEHIKDFGGWGDGDGEFIWPSAVALDSQGRLYVTDEWLHRVSIFDGEGNFLGKVQKFSKDGKLLLSWGKQGDGLGEFSQPWGIAVDKDDNVYVADWRNDRVQKFTSDGQHLATIGETGDDKGQVRRPSDVAVDKDGDVYIADWWNHKVEVFDAAGDHLTTFIGDAERLSKWAQTVVESNPDAIKARLRVKSLEPEWRFNRPTGIAVGGDGRIMVIESQRMRIQIYQKEENWVDPQFNL